MNRVRFAPSPTGSLHVGNALSAVANRDFGDWLLLRIDDTDPGRNVPGGEEGVLDDLRWLGVAWDEGPVRQSSRAERQLAAAREAGLPQRFEGVMLWRDDGSPTFHLASVVDDMDFEITHVIRGSDHRPNEPLHAALHRALGHEPPQVIHHGLVVGDDGKKLSKRAEGATVASLREAGYPAEAVRAYLEGLGLPRHDVHLDLDRIRSLSVDVLVPRWTTELAERLGDPRRGRAAGARRARPGRGGVSSRVAFSTHQVWSPHKVPRRWRASSSSARRCRTCSTRTRRRRCSAS